MTPARPASETPVSDLIPDLCQADPVLRVLLVSQMLACILVLANPAEGLVLGPRLVVISLFLHWIGLSSCALLCALRPRLQRMSLAQATICALLGLQLLTLLISLLGYEAVRWVDGGRQTAELERWLFLARTQLIGLLVWIMLLRYFHLQQQWRAEAKASLEARLLALQARIRPHFLFNALNSLAALIPSQPLEAERLVENLAELFRVALDHPDGQHTLAEELALTRCYLGIEQLRLGERLQLEWEIDPEALQARVPVLSVEPLAENAVYHGIEKRPQGGLLRISARRMDTEVRVQVQNPRAELPPQPGRQMAVDNLRRRLHLLHGAQGRLDLHAQDTLYEAVLRVPL
ncbi:MAG: sensor histidine kinase [Oceanococcaceae bacterium]